MTKFLVTGGAGFIGSHLCERLLENKENLVFCIDNFNDYYNPKIKEKNIESFLSNPNFKLFREDITDKEKMEEIISSHHFDKIIHLAARAGVRASLEVPELYYEVNVTGTKNLLDLAVKYKIKKFIFASSSSVYGINKKIPFSENDEINNQVSPYAKTKKQGEIICKEYHDKYGINITALRFFTVYGPKGRPDMAPYKFIDLVSNDMPIQIYLSEEEFNRGKMARDFTFVKDIIDGIILAVEKNFEFEIFNLGRGNPVKLNEFISIVEKFLNKKAKKEFINRQKGDVPITYADISKAKKMLGYEPKVSFEEGIEQTVNWFQKKEI